MPESEKEFKTVKVLVSGHDKHLSEFLKQRLSPFRFSVISVVPGAPFLETARREHPEIAVIDCLPERGEAAQMEIAVLKDIKPEVRIIAVSQESTQEDAKVVEQGVFYYTIASAGDELLQVIEAAAHAMYLKTKKKAPLEEI